MSDKSRKATDFGFHGGFAAFDVRAHVRQIKKGNGFWISWGFLLPLVRGFMSDKSRKATNFRFQGKIAAFGARAHVRQIKKGNEFWISRENSCLWSEGACPTNQERQRYLDFIGK